VLIVLELVAGMTSVLEYVNEWLTILDKQQQILAQWPSGGHAMKQYSKP
jgi:hypothetical protein